MSHRLEIRPQALTDIAEVSGWYEEQQPGLGERFTREVVATIEALLPNPLLYRLRNRRLGARWCFARGFPYRIVYRVTEDVVTIVAVVHAARHDRRWRERL
ncbi:MAG: type II toxin-antitoxin system RelE/ParE family toxin [Verrucomicrobiales bacterium]|nr:type II toxin-antitoxin system RelE/ParE family toxin [Verrucomicrobiales bacterium]